jgi:signal transduction histidine kinase
MQVTLAPLNRMLIGVHFNGHRAWFVRMIWLLYTLFIAGLYFVGVPLIYAQRLQICAGVSCTPWQATAADAQALYAAGLTLPFYAVYATAMPLIIPIAGFLITMLIVWNRAHDRMALFTAVLIGTCTAASIDVFNLLALTYPILRWPVAVLLFIPSAGLLPWTAVFPDGRFVPHWSKWLIVPAVAFNLLIFFPASDIGQIIVIFQWPVMITLTLGLLYYRYRWYANPVQQQQLRWPLYGTAITVPVQVLVFILGWLFPVVSRPGTLAYLLANTIVILSVTLLMLCFGVAILRYRLLDVGIIVNRALVYGALTAITAGVYGLVVGLLSALLQAQGSFVVSLIATAVVVMAFGPLRDHLQRGVNGLMYGERDEPYRVISRLGQRLEEGFELTDVLPAIVQTVGESLRLPYVAIGLTLDDWRAGLEESDCKENGRLAKANCAQLADLWSAVAASYGQPPQPQAPITTLPLIYQGETVGQLFITPRPGETSLSAADQRLLADLAQQAGMAVHGVRLMTDLRRLSSDLQCSRERLVLAREEERRRLRRDLHDDLAPTLAGLALTSSSIGELILTNPAKASALADNLNKSIRAAVGDIRRLVYDLRPPALDEFGLVAALQERATQYSQHHNGSGLQVRVEADKPLPPLPAAVEVAAYRITQEALMNIVRHSGACTCLIRLSVATTDGRRQTTESLRSAVIPQQSSSAMLILEIIDNGIGLIEPHVAGVGLRSMKERAAELGGECIIERRPSGGTRVLVSLPTLKEAQDEPAPYPYR